MTDFAKAAFVVAVVLVTALAGAQTQSTAPAAGRGEQLGYSLDPTMIREVEGLPAGGLRITVSIYAGRPNPTWSLDVGPELERTVALVRKLNLKSQRLFDHAEWNRLGYASFWVESRGIEGVPQLLHVWRDMAFVPGQPGAEGQYATGATGLYDELVAAAERRDVRDVFRNYHRERKQR